MENRIDQKDAIAFIKGGKAKFVLHTLKTDKQFRYRVAKIENKEGPVWWIYLVNKGLDVYLGFITANDKLFIRPVPDQYSNDDIKNGTALFMYCWDKLRTLEVPERLHILHLGFCGICGRKLKDAISLSIGVGPECRKKIS